MIVLLLPMTTSGTANAITDLQFKVLLDEKPIGFHRFRITEDSSSRTIEIDAEFDVRVLFVPVYRYRHSNTEIWENGCLARIDSETDSNGKSYVVAGRRDGDVYDISTLGASQSYRRDCLMSFAYWDRDILQQDKLLNAQTGELIDVEIESLGTTRLSLTGMEIEAQGYRIRSDEQAVDIKVWYAVSDGRWLSLESRLDNGRVMRYVPSSEEQTAWNTSIEVSQPQVM